MFPVDTIKTRMQALGAGAVPGATRQGMLGVSRELVRAKGAGALFRGLPAQAIGAGPAHAIYFSMYEYGKLRLGAMLGDQPAVHAAAGALATVAHDGFMTPFDVVKQRMQLSEASKYGNILDCARAVARREGMRAFYRSYSTTLAMNVPYQACQFTVYEYVRSMQLREDESLSAAGILVSGGAAGGMAAAITTPLDVVKTRLQTQGEVLGKAGAVMYTSAASCASAIYREEGARGFWKGFKPRVTFHVPSMAICWTSYELVKGLLQSMDQR